LHSHFLEWHATRGRSQSGTDNWDFSDFDSTRDPVLLKLTAEYFPAA